MSELGVGRGLPSSPLPNAQPLREPMSTDQTDQLFPQRAPDAGLLPLPTKSRNVSSRRRSRPRLSHVGYVGRVVVSCIMPRRASRPNQGLHLPPHPIRFIHGYKWPTVATMLQERNKP